MKFLEKLQDFFGIVPSDIYRVDLQCGNCSYTGRYDIDKGKLIKEISKTLKCKSCKCIGEIGKFYETYY